jgi:Transcriptional regulators containing a DNA-binding HTH domain and an aminotransferase domain (MocR family) and their eukaryotic orthologs
LDDQPSLIAQPALAAFLTEGHFAGYLRRQRRIYRARQERALAAAERHLAGLLEVPPDPGGLHLIGYLARTSPGAWTIGRRAGAPPPAASPCRRCPTIGSAARCARG